MITEYEGKEFWDPPRTFEQAMWEARHPGCLAEWHNPWAGSYTFEEQIWVMLQNFPEATEEDIKSFLDAVVGKYTREEYERFLAEEGEERVEGARTYFEGLTEEEMDLYEGRLEEYPGVQSYYEPLWYEAYEAEAELAAEAAGKARRPFHEKQEPYPGTGEVAEEAEYGVTYVAHRGKNKKTGKIIKQYIKFRRTDADVRAVEPLLDEIPPWLAYPTGSDTVMWARPELIIRLYKWREEIIKECKRSDPKFAKRVKIAVNSCYRVLGTTANDPTSPFYDEKGVLDSTDPYGHWTGLSIDVSRAAIAAQCDRLVDEEKVKEIAETDAVGLIRKYDYWHFRPKREYLP
ncbi:MAG: hypothetical protein GTN49_13205 [candidate division Zixibacteria bacterium]|nr:hypothetical protein [candidate division Zixibacteria bacterium]